MSSGLDLHGNVDHSECSAAEAFGRYQREDKFKSILRTIHEGLPEEAVAEFESFFYLLRQEILEVEVGYDYIKGERKFALLNRMVSAIREFAFNHRNPNIRQKAIELMAYYHKAADIKLLTSIVRIDQDNMVVAEASKLLNSLLKK